MGLCHGGMLPYYPVLGRPETATMRHATPTLYEAAVATWRAFWHDLPPCAQDTPPDLICIQPFDAARGDKMDYHSDGVSRFEGQPISMRRGAPVITLNLFADFNFWWRRCHNFKVDKVQRAIRLGDGMCMLWPWEDDMSSGMACGSPGACARVCACRSCFGGRACSHRLRRSRRTVFLWGMRRSVRAWRRHELHVYANE